MGGTWDLDPDGFVLRFFFFTGDVSLRTGPPSPLEWLPFPPLVAAVFITPKGAESPDSGRRGHVSAILYMERQTNNSGLMERQAKSRKKLCLGTKDKHIVT